MSGAKSNRPGLEMAIDFVRSGDTLVVWRLDRLGRNMEDLISIVNRLNERGVSFHSIQENITMDKSSSTGQLMFHLFAAFAEFERNLILERSAAGRAAARARGRFGGRPEKLSEQDLELLKTLVDSVHLLRLLRNGGTSQEPPFIVIWQKWRRKMERQILISFCHLMLKIFAIYLEK